mmetsp:Transcript_43253/g.52440  ORF Transcript_43253/g.52440 Transcript_43253/m.52440 type:complete len:205 (+) Transcript_43253:1139-1753(+)
MQNIIYALRLNRKQRIPLRLYHAMSHHNLMLHLLNLLPVHRLHKPHLLHQPLHLPVLAPPVVSLQILLRPNPPASHDRVLTFHHHVIALRFVGLSVDNAQFLSASGVRTDYFFRQLHPVSDGVVAFDAGEGFAAGGTGLREVASRVVEDAGEAGIAESGGAVAAARRIFHVFETNSALKIFIHILPSSSPPLHADRNGLWRQRR